jgi:DNA-binding response OmpR family regulator/nitrogen-specific signal transduction histidine kinase
MELAVSEMQINGERMFTGIVRDITERKKVERVKSEFISTVSHELRTPLTSIRGALGLVLGKAADQLPEKMRNMLEMANRNSERLTLLINDILDLEKIESGSLEFEFSTVDLVLIARRAVEDNAGYAQKHHVSLALNTALEHAPINGDEHRLLQVFANLISNAVKYSPRDGSVEISVTPHAGGYRVAVRDDGSGIPEEFRSRIFQRFAQADSSDTREKGGTGLGLSITKAIVERHDGQIDYVSTQGNGTVFHFDLPVAQAAIRVNTRVANGSRVLICEDNADVAEILAAMLETEGVVSDIAATAMAARSLLAQNVYRLLLLDLSLPDIDGLQFLNELRAAPATIELPVIVVSGRAIEGRSQFSGDAMMVVDWIQKPVDSARLKRTIREVLSRSVRPHILHVEDDLDIVQVTQMLLEEMADVSHVASVQGARKLLGEEDFDLVILDLGLADGSGIELLDEMKGRCPVVIFSAQIPDREITAQVTAALTKSMTSNEQLLATIMNILEG